MNKDEIKEDGPKIYTFDELKKELDAKRKEELKNMPKKKPYVRLTPKIGRNALCTCGSGKKYKKCCGLHD